MENTTLDFLHASEHFFLNGGNKTINERRALLKNFKQVIKDNRKNIFAALYDDLRKSEAEATISEFLPLMESFNYMIKNLKHLAKPKVVSAGLVNFPGFGKIYPEAYGTVLIISTWNYPLLLSLDPVIGAIAAGNNVLLKMSPNTPSTSRLLSQLIDKAFGHKDCICDDHYSIEDILEHKFDYIFFTGGEKTGKLVARRAARDFTPVTLEMGGKSPTLVDSTSNLKLAAKRIIWGKFMNAGQTCVAPDYVLVEKSIKDEFVNLLRAQVQEFFGNEPERCQDYVRIINENNYHRLCGLLENGKLITGGEKNSEDLYIAPTILDGITLDDKIMEQEIFGPILPIITIDSYQDGLRIIRNRAKPLAAYYFSDDKTRIDEFLRTTKSGGVSINDTIMHLSSPNLPFGGVGASGMGAYHGRASFDTFCHRKSVLIKNRYFDFSLRYLPYRNWKLKLLEFLQKNI